MGLRQARGPTSTRLADSPPAFGFSALGHTCPQGRQDEWSNALYCVGMFDYVNAV